MSRHPSTYLRHFIPMNNTKPNRTHFNMLVRSYLNYLFADFKLLLAKNTGHKEQLLIAYTYSYLQLRATEKK